MIKAYWWPAQNFGDTLTKPILEWLTGGKVAFALREGSGKLLAAGSIMAAVKPGDTVWGTGWHRPGRKIDGTGARFLAVRGPLTRDHIINAEVPEVYGDPAILLPLFYNPKVEVVHELGIIPHYVEKLQGIVVPRKGEFLIDVQKPWREVVKDILSCKKIVASSLHGVIVSQVYGKPTTWAEWSDKIIGGPFKFQDYFLGMGMGQQRSGVEMEPPITLHERQQKLIEAFKKAYDLAPDVQGEKAV